MYAIRTRLTEVFATFMVLAAASSAALAQKAYDPGATDTEIKIGTIMPYKRAGVRLCRDRQDRGRLLQEDQCRRRHQRSPDQFHLL